MAKTDFAKIDLEMTGGKAFNVGDYKGKYIVLYFYPKDSTPGCTQEGHDFSKLKKKFENENALIFGVSRDSLKSHENFKTKQKYTIDLISDSEEKACKAFDVIKEKNMYGKKVMGIERSTFILNDKGEILREWRKVKVDGHAEEVLAAVKAL